MSAPLTRTENCWRGVFGNAISQNKKCSNQVYFTLLISWQSGPLGALQVDEEHLQQGLGTLVCRALSKELGRMGLNAYGTVRASNVASHRLFRRNGFEIVDDVHWIWATPKVPTAEWTD